MNWWQDFMRRVNRANTYQAQLVNPMMATRQAEVFLMIYRANALNIPKRRCKIGRIKMEDGR